MKLISIAIISLFAMMTCQDEHPIFKKHTDIITHTKEVILSEIAAQPTEPSTQDSSKEYLHDYEVLKIDTLAEDLTEKLKTAVLDTESYVIGSKKSCPMNAKYALTFAKKKKQHITLILSGHGCEKVVIHSSEKDLETVYLDLKEKNQILTLIDELKMP